jgi:hypothetical protein
LERKKKDLTGMQKIRLDGDGIELAASCTFSYGNGNKNEEFGTGFFVHKRIILAVKRVEFISDRMSYIILRGHWYNTILLNIEEKIDDINDNFYKELECMFD